MTIITQSRCSTFGKANIYTDIFFIANWQGDSRIKFPPRDKNFHDEFFVFVQSQLYKHNNNLPRHRFESKSPHTRPKETSWAYIYSFVFSLFVSSSTLLLANSCLFIRSFFPSMSTNNTSFLSHFWLMHHEEKGNILLLIDSSWCYETLLKEI